MKKRMTALLLALFLMLSSAAPALASGFDREVYDYVLGSDGAKRFMELLEPMLKFLLPLYSEEGKYTLNIAVGCTGGVSTGVCCSVIILPPLVGTACSSLL